MKIKFILCLAFLIWWKHDFAQTGKSFAMVELFTSEGCSSCPPAEKVLAAIQSEAKFNNKNVYCLEYHVDYWNRLGWKDPYSSFQFTNRQKNYVSALNEESMYTPMMIVNGTEAFTGSDKVKAHSALEKALASPGNIQLEVRIDSVSNDTLYAGYTSSKMNKNFFIRAAITEDGLVSKVSKGENSGLTLTHDGVVRLFYSGEMKSAASQIKIPLKNFRPGKKCTLIAFIQHKQTMQILSVASSVF